MPDQRFQPIVGLDENEYNFRSDVPQEWLRLLYRLNPVTAVVVWAVLTDSVTPATIALARYSPDWERYAAIRTIASGDADACAELRDQAQEELNEVFMEQVPGFQARQILQ